jgi:site-specific recombinase XerD
MIQEMRIRNYSERTIATYVSLFKSLQAYFNKPVKEITLTDVKDYLYHRLQKDNISVSTVNQTISSWKIVYVHLLGKNWKAFWIVRPRKNKALPEVLSSKETQSLINSPKNIKHRAMLYLLYSTGMRRNELLGLRPKDIDSSRMVINIRQGKGKKDRQLPLHPKLLELLREYFRRYRPGTYLFEGFGGNVPYSATGLGNIVKKNARIAGITKHVPPHTLRHCFATHMLEKGANLKIIQKFMGHSSLNTTSVYLSLVNINKNDLPNPLDD